MPNLGQIQQFLEPCDLEIWRMTLKNNRAPLLCCFQLCAWFHCHMWIQTGVKSMERAKLGVDLCDLDLWPPTLTFCVDITFDHGNNSWKFHDDTMMGTWWKRCDRQTDGRTDGQTENTICRAAWSQLKIIRLVFYTTSSFVYHFRSISEFKLELQSENAQSGSNSMIFSAMWPCNLTDDLENKRAPLLCIFKLCASFRSHQWFQTGDTVRKRPIWVKIDNF